MTDRLSFNPVTTEGQLLQQISTQLDELIDILKPPAPSVEPGGEPASTDAAPATGEPEPKPAAARKASAKKATTRKRVTGQ